MVRVTETTAHHEVRVQFSQNPTTLKQDFNVLDWDHRTRPTYTGFVEMKLELVPVPVTDVDRAKGIGFHADHDHQVTEHLRFVQLTPPGSACSIVIGTGITGMAPGSQKGLQVVVTDVEAIRQELAGRGVETSAVDKQPWGWFIYFSDPDGNTWSVQQLVPRE